MRNIVGGCLCGKVRYSATADPAIVAVCHCRNCQKQAGTAADAAPELTFIKAGTLDDTSWLDSKVHVYCDSAQSWTSIPESSQKFAKMPG
jgi:hypothetical protein